MKILRLIAGPLALAGALLLASSAMASPITWTLSGVSFAGGGTATGFLVADVDTFSISSWNIDVTGLEAAGFDRTFDSGGMAMLAGDTAMVLLQGGTALVLVANSALNDEGGTRMLSGALLGSDDGVQFGTRLLTGMLSDPTPAPSPVPEPATWLLIGTGALGLLGLGHRRRAAAAQRLQAI